MSRHWTCIVVAMLYCLLDVAAVTRADTVGVENVLAADSTRVQLAQRRGRERSSAVPFDARTLVRAQIMAVDRETGHVAMQADGATFEADFPSSVVADMKAGDIVFVTVNVINTRIAAITGPVTSVDRDKGTVTVATTSGPFTFPMVPAKLNELKAGDPLVLKLEVLDIGPPGGAMPPSPSPGPATR